MCIYLLLGFQMLFDNKGLKLPEKLRFDKGDSVIMEGFSLGEDTETDREDFRFLMNSWYFIISADLDRIEAYLSCDVKDFAV